MKRTRLLLIPAILSAGVAIYAGMEAVKAYLIQVHSTADPEPVTLAELLDRQGKPNQHVQVRGFHFGSTYVYQTSRSDWMGVWVPVFCDDGRAALVTSGNVRSEVEMERFTQREEVTGVVTNDIESLGYGELKKLESAYPQIDFKKIIVIEDRAHHADPLRIPLACTTLATSCLVLLLSGLAWLLFAREYARPTEDQLADQRPPGSEEMGRLLAVFTEWYAGRGYLALPLLLVPLGLGLVPLALHNTSARVDRMALTASLFVAALVGMVILGWLGRNKLRNRLWVFERGFIQRTGRTSRSVQWSEVRAFCRRFTYKVRGGWEAVGGAPVLRVRGQPDVILLTEADDSFRMGQLVQELTYDELYPRLKAKLEAGEEVPFGEVVLSASGLRKRGKGEQVVPWYEIASVGCEVNEQAGKVYFIVLLHKSRRPWVVADATDLENVGLLRQLANEFLGVL
jgi:hypothetical protein